MSNFSAVHLICFFLLLSLVFSCKGEYSNSQIESTSEEPILMTVPVLFDVEIPDDQIFRKHISGGSTRPELAKLILRFINLPDKEESEAFTLIGGGLNNTGFHGPDATGLKGKGYHFAIAEGAEGDNPVRDEAYKTDFTRSVKNGTLEFTVYYEPTDINEWGERYFPGCELALNLMRVGTNERVLHASNNNYNWAVAGIGAGNRGVIEISFK